MVLTLAADEQGSIDVFLALALLAIAVISRPSLALAVCYQLEDLLRMLVSQLVSIV